MKGLPVFVKHLKNRVAAATGLSVRRGSEPLQVNFFYQSDSMLSNRPGGARIGPKIPDWMSSNLAGREN